MFCIMIGLWVLHEFIWLHPLHFNICKFYLPKLLKVASGRMGNGQKYMKQEWQNIDVLKLGDESTGIHYMSLFWGSICIIKSKNKTKQPRLVRLSELSSGLQTKGSPVRFPVSAHARVAGQVPSRGHLRGNHT